MTLTKADLIETIQSKNSLTKKQSIDLIESIIGTLKDTLASGEDVLISGFGKRRPNAAGKEGCNVQIFGQAEG